MVQRPDIAAWRPSVEGIEEVYHAHLTGHAYPMHAHGTWTLLIIDDGMARYDLHRHERGALGDGVTLLPPGIPHNGTPVTPQGLRKRVLYLAAGQLENRLVGAAVDAPLPADPALRHRIHLLHAALLTPGEDLEAESRLAFVCERLRGHLERRVARADRTSSGPSARPSARPVPGGDRGLAGRLRDLLDERLVPGLTLREAADVLHAHPTHLVRAFSGEFGLGPHQYLIARRVDRARRLLLEGLPPGLAATAAGFYDQAHLHRHFKRILGTGPGHYARTGPALRARPAPGCAGPIPPGRPVRR